MPVQQREVTPRQVRDRYGAPPPQQPPAAPSTTSGGWRPRLSGKGVRRTVLLLLVAWLAYLLIVPIIAWNSVPKVAFEPAGARPAEQPGTTYLLVGSDSRAGLTAKQRRYLHTGNDVGQRTDTIMLLHTGSGPNLLMSIPRDSQVAIPGHGTDKINAAFAWGGPRLLTKTIEQDTGIRIDKYAEIGMGGLAAVVNAVNGITICPTFDMNDPLAGINIKKGCQHANGRIALGYARSRHSDVRFGDLGRAQRQREVVAAIGHKVLSPWTFIDPFRYWRVVNAAPKAFTFGNGMSSIGAAEWVLATSHTTGGKGMTCGVPIRDEVVDWDPTRSRQMFELIKTDRVKDMPAGLCTPTGLPKSITG